MKSKRKRPKPPKPTPAQREQALTSESVKAAWGAKRVDKEWEELNELRARMRGHAVDGDGGIKYGQCCSDRWFVDFWHHNVEYPPGAANTGMRQCPACGALVPKIYVGNSGRCMDCHIERMPPEELKRLPSSHSIIDYYGLLASRKGPASREDS